MRSLLQSSSLRLGLVLCLASMSAAATLEAQQQRRPNPALTPVEDVPGLPRVLLIGDSISMGYTVPTQELLKGRANVHRIPANGGPTTNGLRRIDAWLGDSQWAVIHFNWGLHDLKYMDETGALVDPDKGRQQVSVEDYEKNLDQLVTRLKKTGAKLIWASTTPVPEGAKGRITGDEVKYNAIAQKVMQKHGIAINDLYEFAKPQLAEIQRPKDVHYTNPGSQKLAEKVVQSIDAALAESR